MKNLACVVLATVLWVPNIHRLFERDDRAEMSRALSARAAQIVTSVDEQARLRRLNPEWQLMTNAFVAWSFALGALEHPERRAEALLVNDEVLRRMLEQERADGVASFLLPYGAKQPSSLFVDAQISMTLAMRRLVADDERLRAQMQERIERIAASLRSATFIESYPNEGWLFDHAVALAALTLAERLDGTAYRELTRAWLVRARATLVDEKTGLLASSFQRDGRVLEGPEGSSIWLSIHMLSLVDPTFASEQYVIARRALFHTVAGFGLAREWPEHGAPRADIDSGVQVPLVEASPSSSGFALLAAASFNDEPTLRALLRSVRFAAFPIRDGATLRFAAGNAMGDAVLLYALSAGPAWRVLRESHS